MSQETATQLGTLLRLLEEQEIWELPNNGSLGAENVFHDLDTLISAHQMEQHFQSLHMKTMEDTERKLQLAYVSLGCHRAARHTPC